MFTYLAHEDRAWDWRTLDLDRDSSLIDKNRLHSSRSVKAIAGQGLGRVAAWVDVGDTIRHGDRIGLSGDSVELRAASPPPHAIVFWLRDSRSRVRNTRLHPRGLVAGETHRAEPHGH